MARSVIFLIFIVVAVALNVVDCRIGAWVKTPTRAVESAEDCVENEVYTGCRRNYDTACGDYAPPFPGYTNCYKDCLCPKGFCRNDDEVCVDDSPTARYMRYVL